jgi:translocator protein
MSFFYPSEENPSGSRRPLYMFLLVTLGVGAIASIFTEPNLRSWYELLRKPSFAPPAGLFAPIWTALYVLSAIAAWRVWKITGLWFPAPKTRDETKAAFIGSQPIGAPRIEMVLFVLQLLLTLAWSVMTFGIHALGLGLIANILLDGAVLATLIVFWRREGVAALLFSPSFAWCCFTTLLTDALWQLNCLVQC